MAGHLAAAQAALDEALEVAERFKLSSQVLAATGKIALLKLAANDFDAALAWAERAVAIAPKNCPPIHLLEPTVTIIEANLGRGDITAASRVYSSIENYSIGYECRGATAVAALRVRMSIESGAFTLEERDVGSLLESYSRLRDKGDQDFVVSSLFRALSALGDHARAEQTLKDYLLRHRRDRNPLLRDLRHAAEGFDWAPDISSVGA
jgi:tetratricopeptide (TPR) repeat protein